MPPTSDELKKALCQFIETSLCENTSVSPDTPLRSIGLDSLSLIELVLFLERKYNLSFPEKELVPGNFASVNALAQCAERLMNNG